MVPPIGFHFLYVLYFFFSTLENNHHLSSPCYQEVTVLGFILERFLKMFEANFGQLACFLLPNFLFCSDLFYAILFYSVLVYSILFSQHPLNNFSI